MNQLLISSKMIKNRFNYKRENNSLNQLTRRNSRNYLKMRISKKNSMRKISLMSWNSFKLRKGILIENYNKVNTVQLAINISSMIYWVETLTEQVMLTNFNMKENWIDGWTSRKLNSLDGSFLTRNLLLFTKTRSMLRAFQPSLSMLSHCRRSAR